MKRILAIGIILLFIGSVSSAGFNIVEQSTSQILDGDTLYVGGSGPNNYSRIKDAVNDAHDGDTIFVYNKVYTEKNITVSKSITLIGESKEKTIIDGYDTPFWILILTKGNITIRGFTIKNAGYRDGILIQSDNNEITDCNIYSNQDHGVVIGDRSDNNIISYCMFKGNDLGLLIQGWYGIDCGNVISFCTFQSSNDLWTYNTMNTEISNCVFNDCGIELNGLCDGATVANCQFYSPYDGIYIGGSGKDISVENCTFLNCSSHGMYVYNPIKQFTIRNCTFVDSGYSGIIFLDFVDKCIFSDCKFINNFYNGIYFGWDIRRTEVSRCHFEGNDAGMGFESSNFFNSFSQNNFINNTKHIMREDDFVIMFNFFQNNYWDDWIGFGPYRVFGLLNWDWHPAQEPYDIEV